MKLTNGDLLFLNNMITQCGQGKYPQKIMYALFKNEKILKDSIDAYQQTLEKLLEEYKSYMIINEDGNVAMYDSGVPQVVEEHRAAYIAAINELLSIEIELDLYTVDSSCFDYSEEKYDSLPLDLMRILSKD